MNTNSQEMKFVSFLLIHFLWCFIMRLVKGQQLSKKKTSQFLFNFNLILLCPNGPLEEHYNFIRKKFYYYKIKVPENKIVCQLVQGIVLRNAHNKNLNQLYLKILGIFLIKNPKYKKIYKIL